MRYETRGHRRRAALILVVFCAMVIHQGGAAQVLCIGEDGHVEVESYGVDCCDEAAESNGLARGEWIDAADDGDADRCGACIDIPLFASGRIAVKPHSVNWPDASVWTANTDAVLNHVHRFASHSPHIFNPYSSPSSSATLPLLL